MKYRMQMNEYNYNKTHVRISLCFLATIIYFVEVGTLNQNYKYLDSHYSRCFVREGDFLLCSRSESLWVFCSL